MVSQAIFWGVIALASATAVSCLFHWIRTHRSSQNTSHQNSLLPQELEKTCSESSCEPAEDNALETNDIEKEPLNISNKAAQYCESAISLKVVSGPSAGLALEREATVGQQPCPSVTIGRISQNDISLNDPEVSGRHAIVRWNPKFKSWQLSDKGSLNGTLLNSRPIGLEQSLGIRREGNPFDLSHGDVITAGSSSRIEVSIRMEHEESHSLEVVQTLSPGSWVSLSCPFGVGIAANPMTSRKGGKLLPMEDVALCEWPLRGFTDIGIFCIFDGHAGRAAADSACRIFPDILREILSRSGQLEQVMEEGDASDVLREAFSEAEAKLTNEDEGCTATVLMVWKDSFGMFVAQAANLGDSHCVIGLGGVQLVLTEDHRLSGPVERARLESIGKSLRKGETRLCGLNIARALGDKFLKSQNVGLSGEPYVSQVVALGDGYDTVAILASDGLWDVISPKRAIELTLEAKDSFARKQTVRDGETSASMAAVHMVSRAKLAKTEDNTTVIVIDFRGKSSYS